jgi:putative ABC transport system permease protein
MQCVKRLVINLKSAFESLWEQRQRTVLSGLGITVGTIAIILLVSIATGVQKDVTQQVEDLGVNVLIVLPGRIEGEMMMNMNLGGQSYLKPEDAKEVENVPGVVRTAPLTFVGGGIRYGEKEAYPFIIAADPNWFKIRPIQLQKGRSIQPADANEDVAVIGSIAKEEIFGDQEAVGKVVRVNGHPYRVVGVTQDKKAEQSLFSMGSFENIVYVPIGAFRRVAPNSQIDRIMVQTAPEAEPQNLVDAVDRVIGKRLDRQQYSVLTQEDLLKLVFKLMSILTWLLTGLTSIALFVGGVGILTVMLMSVNERAKEIGIRKATGAKRSDIFNQFLGEAVVLATLGGCIGLAFSAVVCALLTAYTPIKPLITPGIVALGFLVSLGVGSIFGLIPAMRAARRDPVQALRME